MRHHAKIGLAGLLIAFSAQSAQAQSMCNNRDVFVDQLASKYKEEIAARGLQSSERLLEIFASKETGSFTVLLTRPDGISCVLATGTNWTEAGPAVIQSGIEG